MNINAPDTSASPSNYLSFETGPRVHRRRATLPSMILSPDDAAALRKIWSSQDLQSRSPSAQGLGQILPSPEIGIAFTSGSNPNRRSRSAGALHELSVAGSRRRSSEIRYWRTSRIDMEQWESERRVSTSSECRSRGSSIVPSVHNSITEASNDFSDTGSSFHGDNAHAVDLGTVASKKDLTDKHVNVVEARLSQLEFNMQHLSLSLQEITQQKDREPFVLDKAPIQQKRHTSLNGSRNSSPAHSAVLSSRSLLPKQPATSRSASVENPAIQIASLHHMHSSNPFSPSSPTMLSPGSAQTVRPSTSQAVPQAHRVILEEAAPSPLIHDHLAPLYNALRYERSVRKGLETQVLQLRRDVLELGKVVTQIRGIASNPLPVLDQTLRDKIKRSERSRFSGYDSDDERKGLAEKWANSREELVPAPWGQTSSRGEMA